jgi:hypothetical protein
MDNLWKCNVCIVDWCCMCKNRERDYIPFTASLCFCLQTMVYGVLSVWALVVMPERVVD